MVRLFFPLTRGWLACRMNTVAGSFRANGLVLVPVRAIAVPVAVAVGRLLVGPV